MRGARLLLLALAVAGAVGAQTAQRGAGPANFAFIHASDVHVPPGVARRTGPEGGPQFGSAEVVAQIRGLTEPVRLTPYGIDAPAPAFAIATGDLTEFGGLRGWWEQYLQLWAGTPFPVYHVAGNHDATWACQRFNLRKLHGQPYYSFDYGGCHFVGWDSATPQDPRPSFGEEALNWLRRDLERLGPETPVFLFCHHPVDSGELASLYERDRLLDLLRPYNLVLLLVGHGHAVEHRAVAGVDQVMGGSTFGANPGYGVVSLQDGTLRVAYRRAWEAAAARPVLERPLPARATYPRVRIDLPLAGRTHGSASLAIAVRIDRDDVTGAEWQADDVPERKGTLALADGAWRGTAATGEWEPGAHYLRVLFHSPAGDFQRTVAFYTAGGAARPRWRTRLGGSSKSTPALDGDALYVGANDGSLYALDRRTGALCWRYATGGEVLASPLARDGMVYFGSGDGHFYAVDHCGRLRWRYQVGAPVYSSPVWADGMVLFGANDARFYALDAATGKPRWISDEPDYTIESRPWVEGDTVYFGAWDTFVYALNLADGSLRWKTVGAGSQAYPPGVAPYYSPADAGPVVAGGKLYVADRAYVLSILDAATGALLELRKNVSAVARAEDGQALYLRGTDGILRKIGLDGQERWARAAGTGALPTAPREAGGVVYSAGATGRIVALDARDGSLGWEYQATPRLYVFADPTAADGTAYVAGMDGTVTALTSAAARPAPILRRRLRAE